MLELQSKELSSPDIAESETRARGARANRGTALERLSAAFSLRKNLRSLWIAAPGHVSSLDAPRAMGVLWVCLAHSVLLILPKAPGALVEYPVFRLFVLAHYGIDYFFVLSGYLLSTILFAEHHRTGGVNVLGFYKRRAMRILPVYYVVLVIALGLKMPNADHAWANFVYVNNFIPYQEGFLQWTWSLAVEEQFYIVLPLLLPVLARNTERAPAFLIGLLLLAIGIRAAVIVGADIPLTLPEAHDRSHSYRIADALYTPSYMRFGALVVGVAVAYILRYRRFAEWISARHGLTGLLTCLALAVIALVFDRRSAAEISVFQVEVSPWLPDTVQFIGLSCNRVLFSVAFGWLLLLLLVSPPWLTWLRPLLAWKPFFLLAQLSYSSYLVHLLALITVFRIWRRPPQMDVSAIVARGLAGWVLTLIVSLFLYVAIEKPIINLRSSERLG